MSSQITYRPFAETRIWHGYYLHPYTINSNRYNLEQLLDFSGQSNDNTIQLNYDVSEFLDIRPSRSTQVFMHNHKIKAKNTSYGLAIWIQSTAESPGNWIPAIPIAQPAKLTFYIDYISPEFLNYTELRLSIADQQLYYFSNESNNIQELSDAEGSVITSSLFLNSAGLYVSEDDLVGFQKGSMTLDLTEYSLQTARVEVINAFQSEAMFLRAEEGSMLSRSTVNLASLREGRYNLRISNGETGTLLLNQDIYIFSEVNRSAPLAVLELMLNQDTIRPEFEILNSSNMIQAPRYEFWLPNRMTSWRYILGQLPEATINIDANSDVDFEIEKPNCLVSRNGQALVNGYRPITLQLEGGTRVSLPNPDTDRIYPEGDNIYSEVYLSNLNLNRI